MGLDPVCRMEVNPASAVAQSEFGGQTFGGQTFYFLVSQGHALAPKRGSRA
jgi:YHS domain-containing protein